MLDFANLTDPRRLVACCCLSLEQPRTHNRRDLAAREDRDPVDLGLEQRKAANS